MASPWSAFQTRPTVSYDNGNYFDTTFSAETGMETFPRRPTNSYTKRESGLSALKLEPDIKLDPGDTDHVYDDPRAGYKQVITNAASGSLLSPQSLSLPVQSYNTPGVTMDFGVWASTSLDQIQAPELSAPSPGSQSFSTVSSSFDGVLPRTHIVGPRRNSAQAAAARKRNKCIPDHRPTRAASHSSRPQCPRCFKTFKNASEAEKHRFQHEKPFTCEEPHCSRRDGFATFNDLERHRKSVHGATPRVGDRAGYICTECPHKKFWPRKDNFKAHCERRHSHLNVEQVIERSRTERIHAPVSESGYGSGLSATDIVDDRSRGQEVAQAKDAAALGTGIATNDLLQIPCGDDALVGMGGGPLCGAVDEEFLIDAIEPNGLILLAYGPDEYPSQVEWPESTDQSAWGYYETAMDTNF